MKFSEQSLDPKSQTSKFFTLAGGALGGLAGVVIFVLVLDYASGIEVIQTARVGGIETNQSKISQEIIIDRRAAPVTVIERMQTISFAKRVAERIGVDPLDLAAPQYGGKGRLRVRQIGDTSLIEIRSKAAAPEIALKIVATAGDLVVADDNAMMRHLRELIEARIAELSRERAAAIGVANALSAAVNNGNGGKNTDYTALAAVSEALTKTRIVSDVLWAVQSGAVEPVSQQAAIFAEAALARPILSHWWQAVLIGVLAGAAAGFAASRFLGGESVRSLPQAARQGLAPEAAR